MYDFLQDALTWFIEELKTFSLWVFGNIMDALGTLISYIPVPDFMQNIPTYTLPDSMAYFAEPFRLEFGATVIVSAYLIRFIIRRLPIVG